jgi:hypothetical protein
MSKILKYMIAAVLIVALAIPTGMSIVKANKIPTFDIVSVVPDEVVTIQTYDFPANKKFDVLIGWYGSYGLSGIKVASQDSGKGGSFTVTYEIPEEMKGVPMLSIRLEDRDTGYYAYNWFKNAALPEATPASSTAETGSDTGTKAATAVPAEEEKHPSFIISSVDADKSIQIQGTDFPENKSYDVIMGAYGNFGIGGEKVTTQKTGAKGEFKATYMIPADLKGAYMIAVRLESADSIYFAFNYFYNSTYSPAAEEAAVEEATKAGTPAATVKAAEVSPTAESSYEGYPFFAITDVKKDTQVKIFAENLPVGDVFDVYLNDYMGSDADAVKSGTIKADKEGKALATFTIPAEMKGVNRISIRLSGQESGYFAYNFFFNTDYPVIVTTEAPAAAATMAPETKATTAPTAEATEAAATPEAKETAATSEATATPMP